MPAGVALWDRPARHSLRPFSLPKPTVVPAGASARKRSDEMRRRNREISAICKSFEPVMYEVV